MTRDYAKSGRPAPRQKNARVKPSRKSTPGWVWMIAGILIGALATSIFRSTPQPRETTPTLAGKKQAEELSPAGEERDSAPAPKPRFDFYTLLKETEVIVPEQDGVQTPKTLEVTPEKIETTQAPPPAMEEDQPAVIAEGTLNQTLAQETPAAPPADKTVYVLQAGSFKQAADADSVRARLLLLNLQASIEKVTTNDNETWHRVLIGPFDNQTQSSEVRSILSRNGIDSIQLKRKP